MRVGAVMTGAAALVLAVGACKSKAQKEAEAAAKTLAEAGKQMGEAMANAAGAPSGTGAASGSLEGRASEAVDFRELKALLPEELDGMARKSSEGQKSGAMGFTLSMAEARYEKDGGGRIKLSITDAGAVAGMAAMAMYAWAGMEIDKEDENGYEKTTTIKGYRGYEKHNKSSNSSEISLVVANRFIVQLEGDEVSVDDLKSALDKIDFGKLEGMKNVGVK